MVIEFNVLMLHFCINLQHFKLKNHLYSENL